MDVLLYLVVLGFVAICVADIYFDVMYRGIGVWVLSREPINRLFSRDIGASVAAPFIGFLVIAATLLFVWPHHPRLFPCIAV